MGAETDEGEMEDVVFVRYPTPLSSDIVLPELFAVASYDLIDFCIIVGGSCPGYFTFAKKLDTASTTNRWNVCLHRHSVVVPKDQVFVKPFIGKRRNRVSRKSPEDRDYLDGLDDTGG